MFCEGKAKMVFDKSVHLTNMMLENESLTFYGITKQIGNIFKDDNGFFYQIPISSISSIAKKKVRLLHTVVVETHNRNIYTLVKVDNQSMLGKKYAKVLVESLNKLLAGIVYCPKCGKEMRTTDDFCGNCGEKFSTS